MLLKVVELLTLLLRAIREYLPAKTPSEKKREDVSDVREEIRKGEESGRPGGA
ncbi:MAG TPA: hypothetical protein VMZ26_13390 [Pyrinomonadaceae bacterium]|nr:hypothetical protein [Pyrinomonadaceae bacterium]